MTGAPLTVVAAALAAAPGVGGGVAETDSDGALFAQATNRMAETTSQGDLTRQS